MPFLSGTETIKRGASPPSDSTVRVKESTSNNLIKQPIHDQTTSSLLSSSPNNKDETKITESSSSGPTSIQSYDKPSFSKPSIPSSSLMSSNNYKHYSSINTTKSSPVSKADDIAPYKSLSYSMTSTATSTAAATTSSNTIATKTVSVKTNGSKMATTVTNNFKLPPFPVYVPSTSLPSTIHLSSESGLNSKSETSSAAFSSKYSDSPVSSVTTAYSTTLSRLSSSSASPSRTINNVNTTNTLPLHLGRNNPYLYQSESNFNGNATTASYSSPVASYASSQPNYNNVYSTLPKTTASSSFSSSKYDNDNDKMSSSYSSYKYSTDYYSNIASTTNNTTNGTSTSSSSDSNVYRVQYSATNPFLDPVDSPPITSGGPDNISSLLKSSVAETKKKFEKLDSEEDLK